MLTDEQIFLIKNHPTTKVEDVAEWHTRLGWLICVLAVLAEADKRVNLLLLNEQL